MTRGREHNGKRRKGAGRFVQLPEYLLATPAWADLKPGPRALYVELKRRFNGSNNGQLVLSHRDAARALNLNRNTVGAYFAELEEHGFIRLAKGPSLGPAGIGQSAHWALEEEPTSDGKPAGKAFTRWQSKQNPRTQNRTARPNSRDGEPSHRRRFAAPVLKIVP